MSIADAATAAPIAQAADAPISTSSFFSSFFFFCSVGCHADDAFLLFLLLQGHVVIGVTSVALLGGDRTAMEAQCQSDFGPAARLLISRSEGPGIIEQLSDFDGAVYRSDGYMAAESVPLAAKHEFVNPLSDIDEPVWTGTNSIGDSMRYDCSGWTDSSSFSIGYTGRPHDDTLWLCSGSNVFRTCRDKSRNYCFWETNSPPPITGGPPCALC